MSNKFMKHIIFIKYKVYTMQLVFLISIFGLLINHCECWRIGMTKTWLPNLEWLTNENWINGSVPRTNSRVRFPLEMYHSAGLVSGDFSLLGIELPYDGSLVLARDGSLMMNDAKSDGENIFEWKLNGPFYWMDPENWNNSNNAIPHFERIPCGTDTAILPDNNHTLSIRLPENDVNVMEIQRGKDETLDEWNWLSLVNGREFHNSRASVKYSDLQYCGTDCLCKPKNFEELVEEMCSIQNSRCKRSECEYPLKVEGHCCEYCGGRISVAAEAASISILTQLSNEALENYRESVSWHVRASWNERDNQVLFAEKEIYSGIKSQEAMNELTEILIARGIAVAESVNTGAPFISFKASSILGPFFGIPLVIFLLIFVSLPYFGYSYTTVLLILRGSYGSVQDGISPDIHSQENKSFGFARFENVTEGNVELTSPIYPKSEGRKLKKQNHDTNDDDNDDDDDDDDDDNSDDKDNDHRSGCKRFENPLYGSRSKILTKLPKEKKENVTSVSLKTLNESATYPSDGTSIGDD